MKLKQDLKLELDFLFLHDSKILQHNYFKYVSLFMNFQKVKLEETFKNH
jgi:hypothetical protein